jgi:hypothetical protein
MTKAPPRHVPSFPRERFIQWRQGCVNYGCGSFSILSARSVTMPNERASITAAAASAITRNWVIRGNSVSLFQIMT